MCASATHAQPLRAPFLFAQPLPFLFAQPLIFFICAIFYFARINAKPAAREAFKALKTACLHCIATI